MLNYIIQNKEWLFSGLGITILAVILFMAKRLLDLRILSSFHARVSWPKKAAVAGISDRGDGSHIKTTSLQRYLAHPDPLEMAAQLNELPPFQQKDAKKNFYGLNVQWNVSLVLVHISDTDRVDLTCEFPGYSRYVMIRTSLDQYPEIKVMKAGHNITVFGTLVDIESSGPVVEAHRIEV